MNEVGWNDGLRFLLELVALAGWGMLGHSLGRGGFRWVLAVLLPLAAATAWAVFRVPNDPGAAPVAIPGQLRLVLEAVVFGGAVAGFFRALGTVPAAALAAVTVAHYAVAWERVAWLLGVRR